MLKNNYIIVNATALDRGGALNVLKQFVCNIPERNDINWLIFTSPKVQLKTYNNRVKIQPITNVKSFVKRFMWDAFGLKKWLKRHGIIPTAAISLQNTGFRAGKGIPTYIYYHQSIPFYQQRWNPFKKEQRALWFYKNIYPFFVKLFLNKKSHIFVQLNFIKEGFAKKFKHAKNNIKVYSPNVSIETSSTTMDFEPERINLFYPASDFPYKNHQILYNALQNIKKKVHLYLTIKKVYESEDITCLGSVNFDVVNSCYNSCDAVVFPSYIETFGLPLLEAAMKGIPIIAADLPYAREVLDGYEGVKFVKYDNTEEWRKAIEGLSKGKRFKPFDFSVRPGWKDLFEYILKEK